MLGLSSVSTFAHGAKKGTPRSTGNVRAHSLQRRAPEAKTPESKRTAEVSSAVLQLGHASLSTSETLSDISVSADETVRVVYSAPGANGNWDVFAFTFRLSESASDQIEDLIELVRSFDLPSGFERSLIAKLESALDALDEDDTATACDSLSAFINEVQAQSGRKIPEAQADQLINQANQIKQALSCQ